MPSLGKYLVAAGALAAVLVSMNAVADIYKYTDKDGVIHFSRRPPAGSGYHVDRMRSRKSVDTATGANAPGDTSRFTRYDEWIAQASSLYQIPESLIRAVIKVESDYYPQAVSIAGARGLMQLMPGTARQMQVTDLVDPRQNIFAGTRVLRILANDFQGNLELTLAGYNAGEGAVMAYGGVPPYPQTRAYVEKVTKYYYRYRSGLDSAQASATTD